MFDISIPWSVILWMAPFLMPFVSIPGALLAGYGWYRRTKNPYTAFIAALVATFAAPWTLLLAAALVDGIAHVPALGQAALWLLGVVLIVGLVLWGAMHAGSRNRDRR